MPALYPPQQKHEAVEEDSEPRRSVEGPTAKQWFGIAFVCIFGGYWLANTLFNAASAGKKDVHIYVHMDRPRTIASSVIDSAPAQVNTTEGTLIRRAVPLNPFSTFVAGNAGAKVGLVVGGVTTFNTGVSNCDQGNYGSCVTGIISGLLLTAAGLWAPVPGRRSLQSFDNLTIALSEFDASSDHPAQRFIANYQAAIARNPSLGIGARIGHVHYAETALRRHRLIISPRPNGIGRRQDDSDNDGGSISYEWTDFGDNGYSSDKNSGDYDSIASGVAGYLQDNQANAICLTQCLDASPYEVGSLTTQSGTSPDYNADCEFSVDMDSCYS